MAKLSIFDIFSVQESVKKLDNEHLFKKIPLFAFATPRAGNPARNAAGSRTAPSNATAGDGQKNHEMIIIKIPIIQKARVGFLKNFVKGAIMTSLMPDLDNTELIATIIEMINMVDINSVIA